MNSKNIRKYLSTVFISSILVFSLCNTKIYAAAVANVNNNTLIAVAQSNQDGENYKKDKYTVEKLPAGTLVYQLYAPGIHSDYYTDWNTVKRANTARELARKLQINIDDKIWGPRQLVLVYQVKYGIDVAGGKCEANPKFGKGGGQQYLIPENCVSGPVGIFIYEHSIVECVYQKPGFNLHVPIITAS